jgi:hypothetical protein
MHGGPINDLQVAKHGRGDLILSGYMMGMLSFFSFPIKHNKVVICNISSLLLQHIYYQGWSAY